VSGPNSFDTNFYHQAQLMVEERGLMGEKGGSCAKATAFSKFSENSQNISSESFFECPKCHGAIPSGHGITVCPHCGARKEDYGNCV
jgi:rubrerythrin